MAAASSTTASEKVALQLQQGTVRFRDPASQLVTIPAECVAHSKLLCSLVESVDGCADPEVEVPVSPAALLRWLRHVRIHSSTPLPGDTMQGEGTTRTGSAGSGDSNEDLLVSGTCPACQGAAQERSLQILRSAEAGDICMLIMVRGGTATAASCGPPRMMRVHVPGRAPNVVHACARLKVEDALQSSRYLGGGCAVSLKGHTSSPRAIRMTHPAEAVGPS